MKVERLNSVYFTLREDSNQNPFVHSSFSKVRMICIHYSNLKVRSILFLIISFLTYFEVVHSQETDSLKLILKNTPHDSIKCTVLNKLIELEQDENVWPNYNVEYFKLAERNLLNSKNIYLKVLFSKHLASAYNNFGYLADVHGKYDSALFFYNKSLNLQNRVGDKYGAAGSINNMGQVYEVLGNINEAIDCNFKALKIYEELKDSYGIGNSCNNIGLLYYGIGDIEKTLEYYHKSLKYREAIKDKRGIANSYNNLGQVYANQGDYEQALSFYLKGVKVRESINDSLGLSSTLNNIGSLYEDMQLPQKAMYYYERSLKIREKLNDKRGMAQCLHNIGGLIYNSNKVDLALTYFSRSLKLQEEIKDKKGLAYSLSNISNVMVRKKDYKSALDFGLKCLEVSKSLGFPQNIRNAAKTLKLVYQKLNKYEDAFKMYELEVQMKDSVNNAATKKASIKKQFQYQYEKKAAADSVKNAEAQKVKNAQLKAQQAQLKQEKTQRIALYGGLFLVLGFSAFVFNRFKVTQKQKLIIEKQKHEVDSAYEKLHEKNKEVMDSIRYASRIQKSLITQESYIRRVLNRSQNFPGI